MHDINRWSTKTYTSVSSNQAQLFDNEGGIEK